MFSSINPGKTTVLLEQNTEKGCGHRCASNLHWESNRNLVDGALAFWTAWTTVWGSHSRARPTVEIMQMEYRPSLCNSKYLRTGSCQGWEHSIQYISTSQSNASQCEAIVIIGHQDWSAPYLQQISMSWVFRHVSNKPATTFLQFELHHPRQPPLHTHINDPHCPIYLKYFMDISW